MLKNESISSWIKRLSEAYGLDCRDFVIRWVDTFSYKNISSLDFDLDNRLLRKFSMNTGIKEKRLIKGSFSAFKERLPKHPENKKLTKEDFLLKYYYTAYTSKSYYERNKYTLRYCPVCFKEDEIPYFRLFWRFRYYFICLDHNVLMIDRCSNCGKQIRFLEADKLTQCYDCKYDLEKGPVMGDLNINAVRIYHSVFVRNRSSVNSISASDLLGRIWVEFMMRMDRFRFFPETEDSHHETIKSNFLKIKC